MSPISVNDALERLGELAKEEVEIYGSLSLDFEGQCINHIPKSEFHADSTETYPSSIWVDFDLAAIGQREQWLDQFDRRHVTLRGQLLGPEPEFGGCGHFSLWKAKMIVTKIEKCRRV